MVSAPHPAVFCSSGSRRSLYLCLNPFHFLRRSPPSPEVESRVRSSWNFWMCRRCTVRVFGLSRFFCEWFCVKESGLSDEVEHPEVVTLSSLMAVFLFPSPPPLRIVIPPGPHLSSVLMTNFFSRHSWFVAVPEPLRSPLLFGDCTTREPECRSESVIYFCARELEVFSIFFPLGHL